MRRPLGCAPLTLAVALTALGCGNPGGDLIAIEERDPQGRMNRLVVTDDGRGSCNGGELKRLESTRLLEAREVERELDELPGERSDFKGPGGRRTYRANMRETTVTWVEGARPVPEVIPKATLLALRLRQETCPHLAGAGP